MSGTIHFINNIYVLIDLESSVIWCYHCLKFYHPSTINVARCQTSGLCTDKVLTDGSQITLHNSTVSISGLHFCNVVRVIYAYYKNYRNISIVGMFVVDFFIALEFLEPNLLIYDFSINIDINISLIDQNLIRRY